MFIFSHLKKKSFFFILFFMLWCAFQSFPHSFISIHDPIFFLNSQLQRHPCRPCVTLSRVCVAGRLIPTQGWAGPCTQSAADQQDTTIMGHGRTCRWDQKVRTAQTLKNINIKSKALQTPPWSGWSQRKKLKRIMLMIINLEHHYCDYYHMLWGLTTNEAYFSPLLLIAWYINTGLIINLSECLWHTVQKLLNKT